MKKQLCVMLSICVLLGTLFSACASSRQAGNQFSADIPAASSSETNATSTSISEPITDGKIWTKYLYLIEEGTFPTGLPTSVDFPDSPTYSLYINLSYWMSNEDHLPKVKETFKGLDRSKKVFSASQVYYPKQMLEILGEIPENTPSITLEQAKSICDKWKEQSSTTLISKEEVFQEFNAYAAAPDNREVDNLNEIFYYFINETGTEYIRVIINRLSSERELRRITYGSDKEHQEVLFSAE